MYQSWPAHVVFSNGARTPGHQGASVLIRRAVALTAILSALSVPTGLAGQAAEDTRDRRGAPGIRGVVMDMETRQPIEGAAITLRFGPDVRDTLPVPTPLTSVLTDERGRFGLGADRLPDGRYMIAVSRIGYGTIVDSISFRSELGLRIEAALVPEALELDPLIVVVEARSLHLEDAGFYDRQRRSFGRFVTRQEIEARRPLLVSDLLRMMPGVRVSPRGAFPRENVLLLRGGCVADVYIDGFPSGQSVPVDAMLHPNDIEAVEVYQASETPAQFKTTSCGAVVFWTRRPSPGAGNPFTWRRGLVALGLVGVGILLTR